MPSKRNVCPRCSSDRVTDEHECSDQWHTAQVRQDGSCEIVFKCRNWLNCHYCGHRWEVQ